MTTATAPPNAVRHWFAPLADTRTWMSAAYLLLTFPSGLLWFTFSITALSLGVGLLIVWVGVAVLAGAMVAWRFGADVERSLARHLLGVEIEQPQRRPDGTGLVGTLRWVAADPTTWRSVAYLVLLFPFGTFWFVLLTVVWSVPTAFATSPLYYWASDVGLPLIVGDISDGRALISIDTLPRALIASVVGIAALPIAARLTQGAGQVHGAVAAALLGPTRQQLRTQVDDLAQARQASVSAGDSERRRIERDLHDGAQQRLVALAMELGRAKEKLDDDPDSARQLVEGAHENAKLALVELRELARGIHPAVLTDRGLDAALSALAGRSTVPVLVECDVDGRLPASVESAAYFVVAEALANVGKHALATNASVRARVNDGSLHIEVADNGVGGAEPAGNGLSGLADRVGALDGTLQVLSPPGGPTLVRAEFPCAL